MSVCVRTYVCIRSNHISGIINDIVEVWKKKRMCSIMQCLEVCVTLSLAEINTKCLLKFSILRELR